MEESTDKSSKVTYILFLPGIVNLINWILIVQRDVGVYIELDASLVKDVKLDPLNRHEALKQALKSKDVY